MAVVESTWPAAVISFHGHLLRFYRLTGDGSDTSPYRADASAVGISTNTYIRNMSALIRFLDSAR